MLLIIHGPFLCATNSMPPQQSFNFMLMFLISFTYPFSAFSVTMVVILSIMNYVSFSSLKASHISYHVHTLHLKMERRKDPSTPPMTAFALYCCKLTCLYPIGLRLSKQPLTSSTNILANPLISSHHTRPSSTNLWIITICVYLVAFAIQISYPLLHTN